MIGCHLHTWFLQTPTWNKLQNQSWFSKYFEQRQKETICWIPLYLPQLVGTPIWWLVFTFQLALNDATSVWSHFTIMHWVCYWLLLGWQETNSMDTWTLIFHTEDYTAGFIPTYRCWYNRHRRRVPILCFDISNWVVFVDWEHSIVQSKRITSSGSDIREWTTLTVLPLVA